MDKLELPEPTRRQAQSTQSWLQSQSPGEMLVLITGRVESGREALARCIAAALSTHAIILEGSEVQDGDAVAMLAREALWNQAAVIIRDPEQLQPKIRAQLLEQVSAPVLFLANVGKSAQLAHEARRRLVEVTIEDREVDARSRLWERLLRGTAQTGLHDTHALAARFSFGPSRIVSAVQLARTQAKAAGRSEPLQDELEAACRRLRDTRFGDLAQKLACPFTDQDIVLPPKTRQELDLIAAWAKHGARVFGADGQGEKMRTGKGLACLFSGPSGTGKTMAAQVIARRIDFDVYRIDLSQVVNKYIGETEKNLSKLFDEAERSKVVLFFDEADTLFGRRSEVKDAHDRYANIEVGYLLQRLEAHEGLIILATNLQENLDQAFLRRLQIAAEFPVPEASDRRKIWERLLPCESERDRNIDLDLLSERFRMPGGDIRNAIFTALLLAAEDGARLRMRDLALGVWRELQKSGRIVDLAHFGPWRGEIEAAVGRLAP